MSNLKKQIKSDVIVHMKSGAKEKLATLRLLVAEIEKEEIELKTSELTNEQLETVISRQIKKLDKEIEAYVAVKRPTNKQDEEKKLLLSYLPKQLTEDEIRQHVEYAKYLAEKLEIDNLMKFLSTKLKGRADMKLVSKIVKELSN